MRLIRYRHREGNRAKTSGIEEREESREDLEAHGIALGCVRTLSIVQEEDVAFGQVPDQAAEDGFGVSAGCVEASPSPGNVMEARPCEGGIEKGIAKTHGSAEEPGSRAGKRAEHRLCSLDLALQGAQGIAGEEVRMAQAVVFHAVAAPDDFPDESGVPLRPLSHAEEARLGPIGIQKVEDRWRDLGIGAVVEGEDQKTVPRGGPGEADEVWAEQPTFRPEAGEPEEKVVGEEEGQEPDPELGDEGKCRQESNVQPEGGADGRGWSPAQGIPARSRSSIRGSDGWANHRFYAG
ncbi:MAG: hypothetical protein PHP75_06680 [Methylacidiphilaceae bacterium]|nr:hypothetical protein [Candidatus Methylacidiphilaceae bacterium]